MNSEDLKEIIKEYDEITAEHCNRVGHSARILAEKLGYNDEFCKKVEVAGQLHDAGKTKVPIEITAKPGPLTEEERAIMQSHVKHGKSMLEKLTDFEPEYLQAAAEHHAYYNNQQKGYSAETIIRPSTIAQIMALADVYDALDNKRSYKDEMSKEKIREIMEKALTEGQFNPEYYRIFTKEVVPILEEEKKTRDERLKIQMKEELFIPLSERIHSATLKSAFMKESKKTTPYNEISDIML